MESGRSPLLVPARTVGDFMLRQALSRLGGVLGSDPRNSAWDFDDMLGTTGSTTIAVGWRQTIVGTGVSVTLVAGEGGGVNSIGSGATANSSFLATKDLSAISNVSNKPWYVAHRFKCVTGKDAQTTLVSGIIDSGTTKTIGAGFIGSLNANNFIFQYDGLNGGTAIDTGVVYDLNYHVYEMWGRGDDKVHFAFDFGADIGNVTMSAESTASHALHRLAANGTTAAARTLYSDWSAILCMRT